MPVRHLLVLIVETSLVFAGFFWIAFIIYMGRLSYHQKRLDDLAGFWNPPLLVLQPERLAPSGIELRKRALASLKWLGIALGLTALAEGLLVLLAPGLR
jgi:hypothetical protein